MRSAADPPTVLNHVGSGAAERIVAGVPGTRVVAVPPDGALPDDAKGEVLLTLPWGTPNLGEVVAQGGALGAFAVDRHRLVPDRCAALQAVLAAADHLVVAAPSTPATRHLLGAEALAGVKPGVHVVNVSRGRLVDQAALLEALGDGRVARATLDFADPEPLPAGHPLYGHPRVRLSPHVSWSAPGALSRLVDKFVDNLRAYGAGEPLAGVVDRVAGY